jgi:hypothetical protein
VQETTTSSNIIPERMAGRYEDMLTVLAFVEEDMQQDRREEFSALFSRVNAEISRIRLVKRLAMCGRKARRRAKR